MIDVSEGHPFIPNESGDYEVPLNLMGLLRAAETVIHRPKDPVQLNFGPIDYTSETLTLHPEGYNEGVAAVLDAAWVYGAAFLEACERGEELSTVFALYTQAMRGIERL